MGDPLGITPDLGTFLLLGGLLLLEGVRRVPPGALVLRATGAGAFEPARVAPGLRLVSVLAPVNLTVLVVPAPPAASAEDAARQAARVQAARLALGALRGLGALVLLGLLPGIPVAMLTTGLLGTLGMVGLVVLLSLLTTVVLAWGLTALGLPARRAWGRAFGSLSPFAAPRAAEVLLEVALAGVAPRRAAQLLASPASFTRWLRPQLYDALQSASPDPELAALVPPGDWLRHTCALPPGTGLGEPYCPRCAATYRPGHTRCADCNVALTLATS